MSEIKVAGDPGAHRLETVCLSVVVKNWFVALHRYKDAPADVAFLREWHRHRFGVETKIAVTHGNRDLEFFQAQRRIQQFLDENYAGRQFEKSCEMIAMEVGGHFRREGLHVRAVQVDEDGENAGMVEWAGHLPPAPRREPPAAEPPKEEKGPEKEGADKTLPAEELRDYPFLGIEAEGPHRGLWPVLFIPGTLARDRAVTAAVAAAHGAGAARGIYFGAGNDCDAVNENAARDVLRVFFAAPQVGDAPQVVTVEVDTLTNWVGRLVEEYHYWYNFVVVTRDENDRVTTSLTSLKARLWAAGARLFHKTVGGGKVRWEEVALAEGQECHFYETTLDDELFGFDVKLPH